MRGALNYHGISTLKNVINRNIFILLYVCSRGSFFFPGAYPAPQRCLFPSALPLGAMPNYRWPVVSCAPPTLATVLLLSPS